MPRTRQRNQVLKATRLNVARRLRRRALRLMHGVEDNSQDMFDMLLLKKLQKMESTRYLYRGNYRTRVVNKGGGERKAGDKNVTTTTFPLKLF